MTDPVPYSLEPSLPAEYVHQSSSAALRAPDGTDPYTLWIWPIVAIPFVQILPVFFIDWGGGAATAIFSPAYFALFAFAFIGAGLTVWFAYLDWRELLRRDVPKPFHWAWIFATFGVSYAYVVYPIGRSIIVKRRTGRGLAPLWVTVAGVAIVVIVNVWIMVLIVQFLFASVSSIPLGP